MQEQFNGVHLRYVKPTFKNKKKKNLKTTTNKKITTIIIGLEGTKIY
jgi:hypothetical protein